jgi:oxygen-independent coproporphyrinogen-3 oxidase
VECNSASLYIHIPFCRRRCGYCNFTLIAGRDDLIPRFLDCLEREIEIHCRRGLDISGGFEFEPTQVKKSTIFLGGGTPSHLSAAQFEQLFAILNRHFELEDNAEISVECNPNDLCDSLAETMSNCRVNRISLGVQSFNPEKLRFLERDHGPDDICRAVEISRRITENVSMDLIFGVPGETPAAWAADLNAAIGLSPTHLSTYELTIEKGTAFWNRHRMRQWEPPDEDQRAELYELSLDQLPGHGFEQYEISSFCRLGFQCRHNLTYWSGHDYLAFGPGASRYVAGIRQTNHLSTTTYLSRLETGRVPVAEQQILSAEDRAIDALIFGLRKIAGVALDDFEVQTGFVVSDIIGSAADTLFGNELIEIRNAHCRLTRKGIMLYDTVAKSILSAQRLSS